MVTIPGTSFPPNVGKLSDVGIVFPSQKYSALAPACVTAMVCDCSPAVTVIVALREDVDLFSDTLTVIVPFFEPEEVLTVHQVWSLITDHDVLDVMVNESLPASAVNDRSFLFS